jgi:hypothetical protein
MSTPSNPLASLQDNDPLNSSVYNFSSLSYPIDLGNDPAVNHYVLFYINETSDTNYPTGPGVNFSGNPTPITSAQATSAAQQQSTIQTNLKNDGLAGQANIPRKTTRVPLGIALYMPPQIASLNENNWQSEALGLAGALYQDFFTNDAPFKEQITQAFKDTVMNTLHSLGGVANHITDLVFGTNSQGLNAAGTLGFALRAAINPHAEVLFQGVTFRAFRFNWQFFPRSEDEAQAVYNIIQAFKFYAAPELNLGAAGKYWIYPAEFDIKFYSNGQPNNFLNKISTCALAKVAVNYTGNGFFSAFSPGFNGLNGVPTEVHLTLDFIELEVMHKKRVLEGY